MPPRPRGKRAPEAEEGEEVEEVEVDGDEDVAMDAMTPANLLSFVERLRTQLQAGVPCRLTTKWALRDDANARGTYDPEVAKTWEGDASLKRSGAITVNWEGKSKTIFPHQAVAYLTLHLTAGMPGAELFEEEEESAPAPYVFHDPSTYSAFLNGQGDPNVFELRLRHDFKVLPSHERRVQHAFEGLLLWVRAARDMEGWNEGHMLQLGKLHVTSVRDAIAEHDGYNLADIHAKLYGVEHPDDRYGNVLTQLDKRNGKGPKDLKRKAKRTSTCTFCGKDGHSDAQCWLRSPDSAPKHLRDKIRMEAKDFPKGGTGSLPPKTK